MANEVEILDAIMGSNKTNGIIKWMDNHPNEKYIYISPLLSEVDVIDSFDLYSADDLTYLIDNGDVHISEDDGEVFLVNSPVNLYK